MIVWRCSYLKRYLVEIEVSQVMSGWAKPYLSSSNLITKLEKFSSQFLKVCCPLDSISLHPLYVVQNMSDFRDFILQVKDALEQFETALTLGPNALEAQAALYNKACCHAYR